MLFLWLLSSKFKLLLLDWAGFLCTGIVMVQIAGIRGAENIPVFLAGNYFSFA
jgi:hypothetical protein